MAGNFGLFAGTPQIASPDFGASNASGGMQQDAAGMARQQALGIGASPADIQMRAGLMQAQKAAAAQGVSTRGNFGLAGAQHAAQTTQAGLQQSVINQGAQLRAQEQDRALQMYLQAATQKRAGDLQAAGLSTQEAIAQAQMESSANQGNQAMSGKLLGLGLGAAGAAATGGASLYAPAAAGAAGSMVSDERAKQEAFMQGARAASGGDPDVRSMMAERAQAQMPAAASPAPSGPLAASSATMAHTKVPQYAMYDTQTGQPMQEASDARAKQPQGGGHNAAQAFMDTLEPHAFTWKDPNVAPNPQAAQSENLGVYAQDVEKSPWGEAIVHDDPQTGLKQLDIKSLVGALAASAGETHRQQQAHEQRLAALEAAVRGSR